MRVTVSIWITRVLFYSLTASTLFIVVFFPLWSDSAALISALRSLLLANILILSTLALISIPMDSFCDFFKVEDTIRFVAGGFLYSFFLVVLLSGSEYHLVRRTWLLHWYAFQLLLLAIYWISNPRLTHEIMKPIAALLDRGAAKIKTVLGSEIDESIHYWSCSSYILLLFLVGSIILYTFGGNTPYQSTSNIIWSSNLGRTIYTYFNGGLHFQIRGSLPDLYFELYYWEFSNWFDEHHVISSLGFILPLLLSLSIMNSARSLILKYKGTLLLTLALVVISQSWFVQVTPYGQNITISSILSLVGVLIPMSYLLTQESKEDAMRSGTSIAMLASVVSSVLVMSIRFNPDRYWDSIVYGNGGVGSITWINTAITAIVIAIFGMYVSTTMSDRDMLRVLFRWDLALRKGWVWLRERSQRAKAFLLVLGFIIIVVASQRPVFTMPRTFEKVALGLEDTQVMSLSQHSQLVLAGTDGAIYLLAQSYYTWSSPILVWNLTEDGYKTPVHDLASSLEIGSTLYPVMENISLYVATNSRGGSLIEILSDGTIRKLCRNTPAENETFWRVAVDRPSGLVYTGGWNSGLWRYNMSSDEIAPLDTEFNTSQVAVYAILPIREYLFVGTSLGFHVYNVESESWLDVGDDHPGAGVSILDFEKDPRSDNVYIASTGGLLVYSASSDNITYIDKVSPYHGLSSVFVSSVQYDANTGQLLVGTFNGLCTVDPVTLKPQVIEETIGGLMNGVARTASIMPGNVHIIYMLDFMGNLYKYTVNLGLLNSALWKLAEAAISNAVGILLVAFVSAVTSYFVSRYKRILDEPKQEDESSEENT